MYLNWECGAVFPRTHRLGLKRLACIDRLKELVKERARIRVKVRDRPMQSHKLLVRIAVHPARRLIGLDDVDALRVDDEYRFARCFKDTAVVHFLESGVHR